MAQKIIVYGTSTCVWCHKTKDFLKEHKVKFKDIDVGKSIKSAQEMIKKTGQQGVPVIDINGEVIIGYDESKIKKLLKLK